MNHHHQPSCFDWYHATINSNMYVHIYIYSIYTPLWTYWSLLISNNQYWSANPPLKQQGVGRVAGHGPCDSFNEWYPVASPKTPRRQCSTEGAPASRRCLSNSSLVDGVYLKRAMEHHLEQEYHLEMVDWEMYVLRRECVDPDILVWHCVSFVYHTFTYIIIAIAICWAICCMCLKLETPWNFGSRQALWHKHRRMIDDISFGNQTWLAGKSLKNRCS